MRVERIPGLVATALVLVLSACGSAFRPEGDGGWSAERRREEIVRYTPAAAEPRLEAESTAAGATLDLDTALARAARSSRRIAAARERLVAAEAAVAGTRAGLFPRTVASGRYTWFSDPQTTSIDIPPGLFPAGTSPPSVRVRDAEAGTLNATLSQPIDWVGEVRLALASAQAGYRGEAARVWATELEEESAVVRAYFGLLEARRLQAVTGERLHVLREQRDNSRTRFDAGRLTKNELLVVDVALRNGEQELLRRQIAADEARWELNRLTGAAVDEPLEPVDVAERPTLPGADLALGAAREANPVIVGLLEERQRLEAAERSLGRSRLPRIFGGAAFDATTSDLVEPRDIASGFVGFTWDLGSDGRREAEIAEARSRSRESARRLEAELRVLETAVRRVQRAGEERLAALSSAEAGVEQADENLRIRRQQFDAGRATSEDVLDAEALVSSERATLAAALYQAHVRRSELCRLMGRSWSGCVAPSAPPGEDVAP